MSLQVWLPLNGDLHNQGCSDVTVTNHDATINTNGKIGNCYSFAKNAYLDINKEAMNSLSTEASLSFWIKINSWNTSWDTIFQAGLGTTPWTAYTFGVLRNQANYLCFCLSNGSSASQASYQTNNLILGQWYHLTFIYKTGHAIIYENGNLKQDYTTSQVPNFSSITSIKLGGLSSNYKSDCLLNDVRIYDHALSAAEVKEISQGLALHWKLDSIDNNIMPDSSGYGHIGILISPQTLDSTTPRYNKAYSFNGNIAHRCYWNGTAVNYIDNFSYSVWIKANYTGTAAQYLFTVGRADAGGYGYGIQNNSATNLVCRFGNVSYNVAITANTWTHIAFTKNGTNIKIYKNGVQYSNNTFSGTLPTFSDGNGVGIGCFHYTGDIYPGYGSMSDFRIYATALSAEDILALYHTSAKADNLGGFHTFELSETNNGLELLAIPLTTAYGNHTEIYTGYDVNGEITLTGNSHIGSYYIPINPTGKTYYYDIEVSTDSGNVFYIGFQRYDANKTARSNDATAYLSGLSGSSEARVHKHYHGTVDLSTDGVNPCAFISLRILNDWSGANGRHATIHKISLREVSTLQNTKINKQGQAITTELIEMNDKFRVQKNGIIETNEFIEF